MLKDKLEQASQHNRKKNQRLLLIVAAAACIGIGFMIFMPQLAIKITPPPATNTQVMNAQITTTQHIPPASTTDTLKLREQFMQQLHDYETTMEPALNAANIASLRPEDSNSINTFKDHATTSFAQSDYSTALQQLSDAKKLAKQVLAEIEQTFTAAFAQATQAYHDDQYDLATLHIDQALLIKPQDQASLDLKQRIDTLPQLLALLKEAAIAQTENNLQKEYAAINTAYQLAPQRSGLQQRYAKLATRIKEHQFTTSIAQGLANVKAGQLRSARKHYKQAQAIFSQRSELHILRKAIQTLSSRLDLETALAQSNTAIQQDKWTKAQAIYNSAAKRHPHNSRIQAGLTLSNAIVRFDTTLNDYIQRPERLSASNIASSAQQLLRQANAFTSHSAALQHKTSTLQALLTAMNTPVQVTVISDNKTYILVRGVGKVGITQQHNIQLKPGTYSFEGMRKGYKSILITLHIPVHAKPMRITVICEQVL